MVHFSHKREINEALMTENDHECAQIYCRIFWGYLVIYAKDRIILCHCPDARSLKLNKPFLSREKRMLGTSQNCCHWWNFIKVNAWIQLLDLFCLLWMHPVLPHSQGQTLLQAAGGKDVTEWHFSWGVIVLSLRCFLYIHANNKPLAASLQRETLWCHWNVLEYDSWPLGIESSGHCLKALKVLFFLHWKLILGLLNI